MVMLSWSCYHDDVPWYYHHDVIITVLSSWCIHHDVIIMTRSSWCCHYDVIIIVLSSWFYHHHVIMMMLSLWCYHDDAIIMRFSSWCCHHDVVIMMVSWWYHDDVIKVSDVQNHIYSLCLKHIMLTTYALYIEIQSIMVKCAKYTRNPTVLYIDVLIL